MKLLETCKFNPKKYISNSNDFICEHPVLFCELDFNNYGKYGRILECPICGEKFNSLKVTEKALKNRYLIGTKGANTKHYYYAILVIIRKIAFAYSNYSEINLSEILKELDPEIQKYLIKTSPIIQYKEIIEPKVKKLNIGNFK